MLKKLHIDELARQIMDAIPETLIPPTGATKQHLTNIMRSAVSNLDLVSRDEFDAQVTVLQYTRSRLEALETRVSQLEQLNSKSEP